MGRDGLGCGGRAHEDAVRALVLHNRWNVFQSAEDYVVWEVAPARLSDGSVVDLWREESSPIAWQVRIASLISAEYIPHLIGGRRALRLRGRCRRWRAFLACKCSPRRSPPPSPHRCRGATSLAVDVAVGAPFRIRRSALWRPQLPSGVC